MSKKKKSTLYVLLMLVLAIASSVVQFFIWVFKLPVRIIRYFVCKSKQSSDVSSSVPVYKRKPLLTGNEWDFYKTLKPIADKFGLVVLAKIRMADLVETVADSNSEYYRGFAKVKAKHVDFALARPDNLYIELLIELDDSTHKAGNERDAFVESVYSAVGYKLLRTYGAANLEEQIKQVLNR